MGGPNQNTECCSNIIQNASSTVDQNQNVDQVNSSEQDVAIAVAVFPGSVAKAYQIALQSNRNIQSGTAVSENTSFVDSCCGPEEPQATASSGGQSQVQQMNNNGQSTCVAISLLGGYATAMQVSRQTNDNLQTGSTSTGNATNCPVPTAQGETGNKTDHRRVPAEKTAAGIVMAEAETGSLEKAIVFINHGGQEIKIQVMMNGNVLLNGKQIMNLKQTGK